MGIMETIDIVLPFAELYEKGLRPKHNKEQIDKYMKIAVTDRLKLLMPEFPRFSWHYEKISYSSITETYFITIGQGEPIKKG